MLEGSVSKSSSADPLLLYFQDAGYADYDAVEAAIIAAWEGGWDTVPDALKPETVRSHFVAALAPTNLSAASYGDLLPGIANKCIKHPDPGGTRDRNLFRGDAAQPRAAR